MAIEVKKGKVKKIESPTEVRDFLAECNAQLLTCRAIIRRLRLTGNPIDEESAKDCEGARWNLFKALEEGNKGRALDWCRALSASLSTAQEVSKNVDMLDAAQEAVKEIQQKLA